MIDFVNHHVKTKGKLAPKVFKLTNRKLMAGETIQISKRYSFQPFSTRNYYAGEHQITTTKSIQEILPNLHIMNQACLETTLILRE